MLDGIRKSTGWLELALDHNVSNTLWTLQTLQLCQLYVSRAAFFFGKTVAARLLNPGEQSNLEISQLQTSALQEPT